MNANRQTFWNQIPTPAARLGGIGRIHSNHRNTSALSLVFKHLPELPKPRIVGRQRQMIISVHKGESEVFNRDQVMFGYQAVADLMQIIRSLISYLLVQAGYLLVGFTLSVASLDLPGSMTGKTTKFCLARSQPVGVFNQPSGRKGGETFQTNIHTHLLSRLDKSLFRLGQLQHQADIPAFADTPDYRMFDPRLGRDFSVVAQPDFADVLNVERPSAVVVLEQLAAIAIRVFDTMETLAAFEARKTCFFSRFQAAKEGRKGFVQAAQEVLQAGSVDLPEGVRLGSADVAKMRPLCAIANPLPCIPIGRYALFEGGIVDQTGLPQEKVQLACLFRIWTKEVFVGTQHQRPHLLHLDEPITGVAGRTNVLYI